MAVSGAVLCGGASRRMGGQPKVLLPVDGVPMGRLVARALADGGADPVTLVGGEVAWAERLDLPRQDDRWPGEGPLGGLATALSGPASADPAAWVVVAGCDQPWLDPATVRRLLAALADAPHAEVAVGVDPDGRVQPLPAVWRRTSADRLAALVEAGERRLDAALEGRVAVLVPVDPAVVADVDRPQDLPGDSRPGRRVDGGSQPSP